MSQRWLLLYIWFIMTKYERSLLQNMSGFLLQNAAILLQNRGIIRKYDEFITRRESC